MHWHYSSGVENIYIYIYITYSIKDLGSFNYKASITKKVEGNNVEKEIDETVFPLNSLSNSGRTLDIPYIKCELYFDLNWPGNCFLISKAKRNEVRSNNPVAAINNPTNATFKLHLPVVVLSTENDNKHIIRTIKNRNKSTIKWNKYRC